MIGKIVVLALIAVVVAGAYFLIKSAYIDTYEIVGTVRSKWIDPTKEGSAYLIRLTDNTMLEVDRNCFYAGREFNPDIVYDNIQTNKTYKFTCWGWQINWGFVYYYPMVLKAEEIKQ